MKKEDRAKQAQSSFLMKKISEVGVQDIWIVYSIIEGETKEYNKVKLNEQ